MQLWTLVQKTVEGLGYDLVELDQGERGMVRVFIDCVVRPGEEARSITVEDCETVSHQLSRVLVVEDIPYTRLEISSPGLDRPLKKQADYVRFSGQEVVVKLRVPVAHMSNRKNFQGIVRASDESEQLVLEFEGKEGPATLTFLLADVDKARLVPHIDFRSRKA